MMKIFFIPMMMWSKTLIPLAGSNIYQKGIILAIWEKEGNTDLFAANDTELRTKIEKQEQELTDLGKKMETSGKMGSTKVKWIKQSYAFL
jgi:hypothetical protein